MGYERLPVLMFPGKLPELKDVEVVLLRPNQIADQLPKTPRRENAELQNAIE
jgi:hypothetical protein